MNFVLARKKSYFSWLVSTGMRQFCNKLWMEIYNCERPKYKASVAYLTKYLSDHWLIFVICFAGSHDSSKHLQQLTTTLVRWSQCPGRVTCTGIMIVVAVAVGPLTAWCGDVQIQQEASEQNVEEGSASCVQHSSGSVHHCIGAIRPMMSWKPHQSQHRAQIVVSQQPSPQHSTATTLPPRVEMNESDFDKSEIAKCWSWVWVSQWSSVSNYLW